MMSSRDKKSPLYSCFWQIVARIERSILLLVRLIVRLQSLYLVQAPSLQHNLLEISLLLQPNPEKLTQELLLHLRFVAYQILGNIYFRALA